METQLAEWLRGTPEGEAAQSILQKCVHCGFCTATCPTYQLLGDELDSPRGRIYLIKQVVEGAEPTERTQLHLDRCLTCRNCETTCPSGVEYGRLIDIGRKLVEDKVGRQSISERWVRNALREGLTSPLFGPAMAFGKFLRPLLPPVLKNKVPPNVASVRPLKRVHPRKVLLLAGCVQPSMSPQINVATVRLLDALGVESVFAAGAGCCGAIRQHLNDHDGALADVRRNIDAWWPHIQAGAVEAIVVNASGCGVMVKDYGHLLADDARYADKAQRVAALARDPIEYLVGFASTLQDLNAKAPKARVAFHPPCTLQHGQKIKGEVEKLLAALGYTVVPFVESHLCCGSAGTYSVLQPKLAYALRDRKLAHVAAAKPDVIASANIGCITHLQTGTETPVRHWLELLADALPH